MPPGADRQVSESTPRTKLPEPPSTSAEPEPSDSATGLDTRVDPEPGPTPTPEPDTAQPNTSLDLEADPDASPSILDANGPIDATMALDLLEGDDLAPPGRPRGDEATTIHASSTIESTGPPGSWTPIDDVGGDPEPNRFARQALIASACLVIVAAVAFLIGRRDDSPEVARDGRAAGATDASTTSTSAVADSDASSSQSPQTQAPVEDAPRAPPTAVQLVGLPVGTAIQEGEVVEVSAGGAAAGGAVALVVDGAVVDSGPTPGPLSWTASAGTHVLSIRELDTGISSDPVTVEVALNVHEQLRPVSAVATNERSPVPRLRCGGSNSFEAELLIDGNPDTGWGPSDSDGSGQSITIDFGQQVTVARVGLSPGYLRVAPRASTDCQPSLAFEHNRFVERVEYRFDNGSSVIQNFVREPTIQEMAIDPVSTRRVTILIVSTTRQIEDDDTVLSEAVFYGSTP